MKEEDTSQTAPTPDYIEWEKFLRSFEGDFAIHTRVRELILRKLFKIER